MEDAVGEATDELDRVDALPVEVTRVEREAELLAAADRVEDCLGAVQVEGELARVDLTGEGEAALGAGVEDRRPRPGEVIQPCGNDLGRRTRIAGDEGPQSRPGKSTDRRGAKFLRRPDCGNHLLQGALAHA